VIPRRTIWRGILNGDRSNGHAIGRMGTAMAVRDPVCGLCQRCTAPLDSASREPDHPAMAIRLDHTIVSARDKEVSARFLSEMLGLVGADASGRIR
jgi:hypothetical protein